jgi:hypothetical protein
MIAPASAGAASRLSDDKNFRTVEIEARIFAIASPILRRPKRKIVSNVFNLQFRRPADQCQVQLLMR